MADAVLLLLLDCLADAQGYAGCRVPLGELVDAANAVALLRGHHA